MALPTALIVRALVIATILFGGCGTGGESKTAIDGVWNVDFGNDRKGALQLERGNVYAYCHGVKVGAFSVEGDALTMHVTFSKKPRDFSGTIRLSDPGFTVLLSHPPGAELPFTPYTGDCR